MRKPLFIFLVLFFQLLHAQAFESGLSINNSSNYSNCLYSGDSLSFVNKKQPNTIDQSHNLNLPKTAFSKKHSNNLVLDNMKKNEVKLILFHSKMGNKKTSLSNIWKRRNKNEDTPFKHLVINHLV